MWMSEASCIITGTVVAAAAVIAWYYRRNKHIIPKLHYVKSDLHEHIIKTRKRFTSPYRPPFWLQNNHLHTILSTFIPKTIIGFRREYMNLKDGGVVALDWVTDNEDIVTESTTVLIILPGLTATREDMGEMCKQAMDRGYRVVVFNKRGHGNSVLATPKLQGFGDTDDLRHCVVYLRDKFPSAKLVAIGSSAGSALLASYLGEFGADCLLTTGANICPGYDALELFVRGMSALYEYLLLSSLKKILKEHADVLAPVVDLKAAHRALKFTEFDTEVYCKIYGYKNVTEYWKYHNPMRNVTNNVIPVMCINSLDDPICKAANIPFHLFCENEGWLLVTTDKGGHCGFLEEDFSPWCDKVALDYIDAVLEHQSSIATE